jgi:hypothetical protein
MLNSSSGFAMLMLTFAEGQASQKTCSGKRLDHKSHVFLLQHRISQLGRKRKEDQVWVVTGQDCRCTLEIISVARPPAEEKEIEDVRVRKA